MMFGDKFLIVIEWLLFMEWTTAYKTGCSSGYCFVASNPNSESSPYINAQNWCMANGTNLVEIRDGNIQDAISSFIRSISNEYNYNSNTGIFTNGKRLSMNWSRINGYGIGNLSIANSQDSSNAYAFLQHSASNWNFSITASTPIDSKNGYICQDETTCAQNGGKLIGGNCYKNYEAWCTWYDARQKCLTSGGDLASLDSITDDQQLKVFNSSWLSSSNSYWIGIRRERWQWNVTNSDIKYSNWDNNHPIVYLSDPFDCLCISPWSWKWTECRCTDRHPFLCFSEPSYSTSMTNASTTISTPASATAITMPSAIPSEIYPTDQRSNSGNRNVSQEIKSSSPVAHRDGRGTDVNAAIGIGVGVGAGIIVVAIVIVVVVIIICKRRLPRTKGKKKTPKGLQPPDVISLHTNQVSGRPGENPYSIVVNHKQSADSTSDADNNTQVSHTVYADLKFVTTSTEDNKKRVTDKIKGGSRKEKDVNRSNGVEQEYANITRA